LKTKEEFLYHVGEVKNLILENKIKLKDAWDKFALKKTVHKKDCNSIKNIGMTF